MDYLAGCDGSKDTTGEVDDGMVVLVGDVDELELILDFAGSRETGWQAAWHHSDGEEGSTGATGRSNQESPTTL